MKRCQTVNDNKLAADSLIVLPIASDESLAESAAAEALLNLMNSAVPSNSGFDEAVFFTTSVNEEEHANKDEDTTNTCKDADSQLTEKPLLATMTGSIQVLNIKNATLSLDLITIYKIQSCHLSLS